MAFSIVRRKAAKSIVDEIVGATTTAMSPPNQDRRPENPLSVFA
jgi:hypothetical protein